MSLARGLRAEWLLFLLPRKLHKIGPKWVLSIHQSKVIEKQIYFTASISSGSIFWMLLFGTPQWLSSESLQNFVFMFVLLKLTFLISTTLFFWMIFLGKKFAIVILLISEYCGKGAHHFMTVQITNQYILDLLIPLY